VENQRADKEMAKAVSPIDNGKDRAPPTTEQTPIVKEVPPDELKKTQNFELLDNIESEVLKNLQDINKLSDSLETNNEPKSTKPKVYVEKSSTVIQVVDHDYEVPEAERDEKRIESDFSDTESSDEGNRVEEFVDAVSEVHPVGLAPLKRKSVSTLNITLASTGEPGESATGVPISVVKNSTEVKMIQPSESTREDVVVESTAAIQLQSAPPKNGDVGASEVKAEQKRDLEASTKQNNTATSLEVPPVLADSDKERALVMPSVEQDGGLLASGVEKNVESRPSTSTAGGVEENKNVELADGTNLLENERQSVETGLKEKLGEKMTEGGVGGGEIAADVTSVDLESCTMSEDVSVVKNENNDEIVANLIVAQQDVRSSVADVKEELNEDVGAGLGTCEVESDLKRNVLVEENATKAEKNGDSEQQIGQRKSASPRLENDRCRKVRPKEVVSSEKKDLSRSGQEVEVVSQSVVEVKEEKEESTGKPVENKPPLTKKQKKSMKRAKRRSQRRAARRGSTSTTESSSCEKPLTETDSEPNQKEPLKEVHEEVKNSEDQEAKPRDVTSSEQPKTDVQATTSTDLPENVEIHPKISTTVQIAQNKQSLLPVPPKRPSRIPISRQRSISKSEPKSPDVHTASKIPIKTGSQIPVKNKQHNNIDHTGEGGSVNNSQTGESPGEVVQTSEDKPSGSAEEIVGRSGSAAKDEGVEVEEVERPQRPCVQRDKSEEIEQEMKQSVQAIKELNRQLNTNSKSKKGSLGSFRNSSVESTTSSKQLSYTKSLDNDSDSSVSDSNVEELLDPSTDEDSYEDFEEYDEVEESDTEDYNEFDRKNARIVDELDINLSQISAKVEKLTTDLTDNKNDYLDEVCESEEYSSEEEEEAEDESDNKFDVSIEVKQPSEIEVMEVRP
jgi:hypothetical protein